MRATMLNTQLRNGGMALFLAGVAVATFATGCKQGYQPTERDRINVDAALPANLPYNPLQWQVVTSGVDRNTNTMWEMFGNDAAVTEARADGPTAPAKYGAGAVLAVVTWAQQDDRHWFGARIPRVPVSVEFVSISADKPEYTKFSGTPLTKQTGTTDDARVKQILAEQPSFMP